MERPVGSPDDARVGAARGLSVVIVTYNSARHLRALATSLPAGLAGVGDTEIIVADNASSDDTVDLLGTVLPQARVVRMGRNAGYAAGINAALAVGQPGWNALVLNPDVELLPGAAAVLHDAVTTDGTGIATPLLTSPDGAPLHSIRREPSAARVWAEALLGGHRAARLGLGEVVDDPAAYRSSHPIEWATGAVVAVSAECRAAIGDWDDTYFLYSEEVDYFRRAREAGFTPRFVADAAAVHEEGEYEDNPRLWRLVIANRAEYHRRHNGPLARLAFRLGLATSEALRSPRGPAHRAGLVAAVAPGRVSGRPPVPAPRRPRGPRTGGDATGIVWFAAQDWWYHNQAHSDFQLMRAAARTRPVLVVNSLGLRMPRAGVSTSPGRRILRKLRSTTKAIRRPDPSNPGFHVMTPLILPFYGDTRAGRLSSWLIRRQVVAAARAIGLGARPGVGVTIPTAWPVVAGMRRSRLVLNRSDLHSAFPEADGERIRTLEEELLVHSDAVAYVSRELQEADRPLVGDRGFFLDHGVDLEHFTIDRDRPLPADLATIPAPRIGFFGGLDDYVVDIDLLRETAERLPEASLVLVGDATCDMDELVALPNVHWLGYRPYEHIPDYGRGFDVALMPWLDNEWIRHANPIKLKEYLALGLTVVSTEYPQVDDFRDQVRVAASRGDFPDLVADALARPADPLAQRASVLDHSWSARAELLLAHLDGVEAA